MYIFKKNWKENCSRKNNRPVVLGFQILRFLHNILKLPFNTLSRGGWGRGFDWLSKHFCDSLYFPSVSTGGKPSCLIFGTCEDFSLVRTTNRKRKQNNVELSRLHNYNFSLVVKYQFYCILLTIEVYYWFLGMIRLWYKITAFTFK